MVDGDGQGVNNIVTREQHLKNKEAEAAHKTLAILQNQQLGKKNVNEADIRLITKLLEDFENGIIKDPLMVSLLEDKLDLAKVYAQAKVAMKQLEQKLIQEISAATNNMVKCNGAMEQVDRMILKNAKKDAKPVAVK